MLIVFLVILVVVVVGEILYGWEENRNGKRKK